MCMTLTLRLLCVGFSLMAMQPVMASSSDWLQVERFKEVLNEAEKGKVASMYEVGLKYERGRGTVRDIQKAAEWYHKASDANHAPAKARLGILYVEGHGVERDLDRAIKLLSEAAEQDVASAQYQLANMYELGTGFDTDLRQAIRLYRKAAEGGYYPAQGKAKELSVLLEQRNRSRASSESQAPKPAPARPAKRDNRTTTLETILKGNWQRSGRPSDYLPSSISQCREQDNSIKCITTPQERSTGTQIITYNTEATLTNFNGQQFQISYVNNVLEVEQQESDQIAAYEEDENVQTSTNRGIQSGQQSIVHQLECSLESNEDITCVKDQYRRVSFTRR